MEKIEDVEKFLREILAKRNINLDEYKIPDKEYCKVCGELISFISDKGYLTGRDCRCMRTYRVNARLKKIKKYSVNTTNEKKDIFSNADRSTMCKKEIDLYKKAYSYCKNFSENLKNGGGFLFQGVAGSGKTFLANCICNKLEAENFSVISLNLGDYLKILREDFKEEDKILAIVKDVDMLFIDDVGSEQINRKDGANWGEEKIYNLFNTRNIVQKPLIVTTNLTESELKNHLRFGNSDKIFSRLNQMVQKIEMNFDDKRLKKKFKILF